MSPSKLPQNLDNRQDRFSLPVVELRLNEKGSGSIKAFADVTITFGAEGGIKIAGFSVLQADERPPRVMPPSRKGGERFFDVVTLIGRIRQSVEEAVLSEYLRQTGA